jgi:hypothetical protein
MQNLIQAEGGHAQKETHFVPLFTSRFLVGIYTNRSLLRSPLQSLYSDFYHVGATDALCDGLNSELSIRQTMIRRPGNPLYCTQETAAAIDDFYSFDHYDGTVQVIADSAVNVDVVTPTTLTSIFTKSAGAGEGYFQGVVNTLYITDGVDTVQYLPDAPINPVTGNNLNPVTGNNIWNFGGVAPTTGPTLKITEEGTTGIYWTPQVVYSTMGLVYDSATGTIFQLNSVNADGSNTAGATIGTSSPGGPDWLSIPAYLNTLVDGTVTWTNYGPILLWQANHLYNGGDPIYDPGTGCVFIASHNYSVMSGGVYPTFTPTLGIHGARVTESTGARWENIGQVNGGTTGAPTCIKTWKPATVFNTYNPPINGHGGGDPTVPNCATIAPSAVLPSTTAAPVYLMAATTGGTTAASYTSPFGTVAPPAGTPIGPDGQLGWLSLGLAAWAPATGYSQWASGGGAFSALVDANGNFQVCIVTGVSAIAGLEPGTQKTGTWSVANAVGGNTTYTAPSTISPAYTVGSPVTMSGFTNAANNGNFKVVSSVGATLVLTNPNGVAETHAAIATFNPWGTTYGAPTTDGTVQWTCVGTATPSWEPNTQWYLPTNGFAPPTLGQPYGGASIIDSNGINQFVYDSGLSGSPYHPSWEGVGDFTTDNTITWIGVSDFVPASFSWSVGYGYCYCFASRLSTDYIVNNAPPLQIPGTNSPNATGPIGVPTGAGTGSVTTASPVTQIVDGNTGAQVLISGVGSLDPQFDTIIVFRSADSFGSSGPYLYLTSLAMPAVINSTTPGTWSIIDFMPDLAGGPTGTNGLPGLDTLITAPIDHFNDPPPGAYGSTQFQASPSSLTTPLPGTTLIGQVYSQGRLWGFIGNTVFASGGPDTVVGNGFTAWPPDYAFPFNATIIRLEPTPTALLVFTSNGIFLIGGGPAITDYYSQPVDLDLGVLSYNAVAMVHGIPYIFSADKQLISLDPSGGITRIGHPVGDKLSSYNPADVYVVHHHFGDQDHAIFISNGSSEWYRCDPNPTPDSQLTGPVWSPRATIAGGFQAMASVVVSPGVRQLLIGPASAGYILNRDSTFTTFADNTSPYDSYFTMGNIVMAHPGQMAELSFIEMDFNQVGTQPTVSVLFDELSATNGAAFEVISNSFVSDPPKLYGPTATPDTMWMDRYYFGQTESAEGEQEPLTAWCKHMQIKVDFGNTDEVENELLAFTIFGALWQEK